MISKDELIQNFLDHDKKDDELIANVLSLKNELK